MINQEVLKNEMQQNPKKILQFLIGLSMCLLLIWVVVILQLERPTSENYSVEESGRLDSLKLFLNKSNDLALKEPKKSDSSLTATNSNGVIFPGLLLLLVSITSIWWWIQKKTPSEKWGPTSKNELFKIVARQDLEVGQKLILLEMNEQYWLLAVSANQTNLLHRCNKHEWKESYFDVEKAINSNYKTFMDVLKEQGQKYRFWNN